MQDITVQELRHRINEGEKLNIIDVREEWEYNEYNIGAKLIPLGELPMHMDYLNQFKDQELILHCRSGGRSGNAKQFLVSKGFTNVRNLLGGILEWQKTADAN
jgi:rhodanese-related sulfurtransferase